MERHSGRPLGAGLIVIYEINPFSLGRRSVFLLAKIRFPLGVN
jgi:hypothetical protein